MKVGYTEFSFGYAFTENLIHGSVTAPTCAPVFPNLLQEATLDYDVQIGFPAVPLFFQYEFPELMTRASAFEIKSGPCPALTLEFFRIALMCRDIPDQRFVSSGFLWMRPKVIAKSKVSPKFRVTFDPHMHMVGMWISFSIIVVTGNVAIPAILISQSPHHFCARKTYMDGLRKSPGELAGNCLNDFNATIRVNIRTDSYV